MNNGDGERRSWLAGLAPRYAAYFLLIVFFDGLGPSALRAGGLGPALLGVAVGGALGFSLLYYPNARCGLRHRVGFIELAEHSFGRSNPLPSVLLGIGQFTAFAAVISYAVHYTLLALVAGGLLSPSVLSSIEIVGREVPGFAFQATAVLWIIPAVLLGPLLLQLVAAILHVYQLVPGFVLVAVSLGSLAGIGQVVLVRDGPPDGTSGFLSMVQWVFAYSVMAGVGAAEWGSASRSVSDVRRDGLIGMFLAPVVVAGLSLVTVLLHAEGRADSVVAYSAVLSERIGGPLGCVLLMAFDLALLGPACSLPAAFVQTAHRAWPRPRRWAWSLLCGAMAWPLVATGAGLRLEAVYGALAAILAPLLGVMSVDGPRRGDGPLVERRGIDVHATGCWLAGALIGLAPALGLAAWPLPLPAAVLGWLAAALARGTRPG